MCVFTYAAEEVNVDPGEDKYIWSVSFILWMSFIIIIGRIFAVWSVHFLFRACQRCKGAPDVDVKELVFITWGGMIRGAIAFGLVLKIPVKLEGGEKFKDRNIIITTTLAVVIFTTVFFGTFMNLISKCLF